MKDRISYLENILDCDILQKITLGTSLEKYKAVVNDETVMLRIIDDSYYGDRFLREGIALRSIENLSDLTRQSDEITLLSPRIVEEWPEFRIRAIEWVDFNPLPVEFTDLLYTNRVISNFTDIHCPFSLEDDIKKYVLNQNGLHIAYEDGFTNALSEILDVINWNLGIQGLIHGDFHRGNAAYLQNKSCILVYDWEFSSYGSSLYDLFYLMKFSDKSITPVELNIDKQQFLAWEALVTAVISSWYLREDHFSPKLAIEWYEKLNKLTQEIV